MGWTILLAFLPDFSAMRTLPALNIEDIGETPGGHIWDTWDTFELALRPYLGRQLTFTAPTKCDPSAGHYSGHPSSPPPPPSRLNLRQEFGDNPLIDLRGISSCIMDMSYHSWSRPSLCDSGLQSALPEYWYDMSLQPPCLPPPFSVLLYMDLVADKSIWTAKKGKRLMKKTSHII